MPAHSLSLSALYVVLVTAGAVSCSYALHRAYCRTGSRMVNHTEPRFLEPSEESWEEWLKRIWSELPRTLGEWRGFQKEGYSLEAGWIYIWDKVQEILDEQNATLWDPSLTRNIVWAPKALGQQRSGGLAYVYPGRAYSEVEPGSLT
ncbi:hypothetical protein CPC08DRAFT_459903 [Agrocybe pediades]|nr:hypothetical protein CPC08DRAFT_459903 [Agrocybe pediades]